MAKVALLIGVSEYEPGLSPLAAAVRDVEAMRRVLQHPEIGAFAESDIKVLKNPARQEMEDAIQALFDDRHRDDLVLLFFSGHGIKDSNSKFYLSSRTTRKTQRGELMRSTATSANSIQETIRNSRSRRNIVILDCCFSGAFAEGMQAKDDGSIDIRSQLGSEGVAVLTSSSSIEYSFEQYDSDLSVYTRFLAEGLETGEADQDHDGFVGIKELHEYAKRKVREVAPQMKPEIYVVKEGYEIKLAIVPPAEPASRYRQEINRLAFLREITFSHPTFIDRARAWLSSMPPQDKEQMSSTRRKMLDAFHQKLGLSLEEARQIELDTLAPYHELYKKGYEYEQELVKKLRRKKPLQDSARRELREFKNALGISDEWATTIERRVSQNNQRFFFQEIRTARSWLNPNNWSIPVLMIVAVLSVGGATIGWMKVFLTNQQISEREAAPEFTQPSEPSPSSLPSAPVPPSDSLRETEALKREIETHRISGVSFNEQGKKSKDVVASQNYYQRAIDEFTQAINLEKELKDSEPRDPSLYAGRGYAHLALGTPTNDHDLRAFDDYKAAINLKPDDEKKLASYYEWQAHVRVKLSDSRGAKEDCDRAINLYVNQGMTLDRNRVKDFRGRL